MATANNRGNKPKKEGNNITKYVYNMNTLPKPPPESVKKAIPIPIPIPRGWGSLMRSKTYREKTIHEVKKESVVNDEILVAVKSRRSVELKRSSVSEVELVAAKMRSAAELLQVKVLVSDMAGFMQLHAFRCARTTYDSLETFSARLIAYNIKKEFDKVYGPAWHCLVGSSFGSFVTHSTGGFLYFSMENLCILVFKTKVQKALQYS